MTPPIGAGSPVMTPTPNRNREDAMEKIVERVARVLWKALSENVRIPSYDTISNAGQRETMHLARESVLETLRAVREPSEGMQAAAREWSRVKYGKPVGRDGSDGCWQAQIDQLIKEIEADEDV